MQLHCSTYPLGRIFLQLSLPWLLSISTTTAADVQKLRVIGPTLNETHGVQYDLENNYCWVLAHQSALIEQHSIIMDSGIAKYGPVKLPTGEQVFIVDLNGEVTSLDLTKPFAIDKPTLKSTVKPLNVPVVSRGSVWIDSTGKNFYIQGGRFYVEEHYKDSKYYVPSNEIPKYSVWRYNIPSEQWANIADELQFPDGRPERAFGGAALSIPAHNTSYYFGGFLGETTMNSTANAWIKGKSYPAAGMLIFDHATRGLKNESIQEYDQGRGSWHGTLLHLNLQPQKSKGMLLSLMAEKGPLGELFPDLTSSIGNVSDFTEIKLYDIDKKSWYTQKTMFMNDERPIVRTRFCADIVHEEGSAHWELWIYGGQQVEDQTKGVDDVWVLTMPAFVWVRVKIPGSNHYSTRSQTCHAVGKYIIILGGTLPDVKVNQDAPCDDSFIKLWNMNDPGLLTEFSPGTKYIAPRFVREWSSYTPMGNLEWGHERIEGLFPGPPKEDRSPNLPPILGGVAAGLIGLALGLFVVLFVKRWKKRRIEAYLEERRKAHGKQRQDGSSIVQTGLLVPSNGRPPSVVNDARKDNSTIGSGSNITPAQTQAEQHNANASMLGQEQIVAGELRQELEGKAGGSPAVPVLPRTLEGNTDRAITREASASR